MDVRVVIDAGHGGQSRAGRSSPLGCRGPRGTLEKDVTLALARRLAERFGGAATLTRSADVNLSLVDRASVARRHRADVFLSIHANSGRPGARGREVWVHRDANEHSRALAVVLGGDVLAGDLAVLHPRLHVASTAACLLEVDYLSDPDGELCLVDPDQLDHLAGGLFEAVTSFLVGARMRQRRVLIGQATDEAAWRAEGVDGDEPHSSRIYRELTTLRVHTTHKAGGTFTATDEVGTFSAVSQRFYGSARYAPWLQKSNPTISPKAIRAGRTVFVVPRFEIALPVQLPQMRPTRNGIWIGVGSLTYHVERDARGSSESLTPSWPGGKSGVTIGHGYDMGARSADQVELELTAAGVPATVAAQYRGAAGRKAKKAKQWVATHRDTVDPITFEQEWLLFKQEYERVADAAITFITDKTRTQNASGEWTLGIDFATLESKILEVLVDIRYKGNLGKGAWAYLSPAVLSNDLSVFGTLVADWTAYRKHIADNWERYEVRCRILGVTPEPEN